MTGLWGNCSSWWSLEKPLLNAHRATRLAGLHIQVFSPSKRQTYTANMSDLAPPPSSSLSSIADLRKSYERAELDEQASHSEPLLQFDQWLRQAIASEVPEPNAMTLATVSNNLRPSTRVVLIKGYDERGITWFTNYESRKAQDLAGNPFAALQFHWLVLERVVRIEGAVYWWRTRPNTGRNFF